MSHLLVLEHNSEGLACSGLPGASEEEKTEEG